MQGQAQHLAESRFLIQFTRLAEITQSIRIFTAPYNRNLNTPSGFGTGFVTLYCELNCVHLKNVCKSSPPAPIYERDPIWKYRSSLTYDGVIKI